jgi:hypothetical protein
MRSASVFALISAACAGACDWHAGTGESVRGTFADVVFVAQDAYVIQSESSPTQPPPPTWSLVVVLTSFSGACETSSALHASGTEVTVSITRDAERVAPGTFSVSGGNAVHAAAIVQRTDQACQLGNLEAATSGDVTIAAIESTEVRGSLSFQFPDGSLSGDFVARFCGGAGAGGEARDAATPTDGASATDAATRAVDAATTCH